MKKQLFLISILVILSLIVNAQTAYITNFGTNTVSVINVATNTVIDSVVVGNSPYGVCVHPDGSKVYIANSGNKTISVINTATNTVTATITVGDTPSGIAISPDGSKVYVVNHASNTVNIINTTTNAVTDTISVGSGPLGICVSPDGNLLYVSNENNNSITKINTITTASYTFGVGGNPMGICLSPDGSTIYVANNYSNSISTISTSTNAVLATITGCNSPRGVSVSPDGKKIYVTDNLSTGRINIINTATNTISATILVGSNPFGISVSPDGSKVYVANYGANTVSVIDTATNTVSSTIAVGNSSGPTAFGNFISTPCSAQFALTPDTITPHYYFGINNASGIPPLKYLWSWGDGTYDSIAYPTHTYSMAGYYTICLTIIDSVGCTTTYCNSSYLQKNTNPIISVNVIPSGTTGINEHDLFNQIKIYPNPANYNLTIETPAQSTIQILNIEGQLIKTLTTSGNKTNIDVAALPGGIYFVKVKTERGIAVKNFIKE
jgi:YVTN family beta-propeller protein